MTDIDTVKKVRDLNKVTIIGNLSNDPTLKETVNKNKICKFTVITTYEYITASRDRKQNRELHFCVSWDGLAETCAKILYRGCKVYVEGRLSTRKFIGDDGISRNTTEIIVEDFLLLAEPKTEILEKNI